MEKVSVALATYNGEKFLKDQLDSLYNQTRLPDEVIVVDDCSTDNTISILDEYAKIFGLKYFINKYNLGVNKNFESAISKCSGDYIALCDQDDIWFSQKVEKTLLQLKEIEKNGLPTLVTSTNIHIDHNGAILGKSTQKDSSQYAENLWGNRNQGCTMMMNRKLLNEIIPFPSMSIMYDAYIGLTSALIGNKFNIGEPLMYYRLHSSNEIGGSGSQNIFAILNRKRFNYAGFFHPKRLEILSTIEARHKEDFITSRVDLFYKLKAIHSSKILFNSILLLFKIKELSFFKKVYISFILAVSEFIK